MNNFIDEFIRKQIKEDVIKGMRGEIQKYINMGFDKEEIEACYIGQLAHLKRTQDIPLFVLWVDRIYNEIMKEK